MARRISDIHSLAGPLRRMGRHSLKMSHKLEMNNLEWVELGCGLAYGSEPEYALFCTFRFYTVCDGMNLKYWN